MKQDETLLTHNKSHESGESHEPREFQVRVEKVKKLQALGIDPWPPAKSVTAQCEQVKQEYHEQSDHVYAIAGRLMTIRVHGKTAFAHVQDSSCRLQIYLKADILGEQQFKIFEDLIDPGDIIWCQGTVFKTKTGEITLKVEQFTLLSKCLEPLPEKFHGLTDIETKYRQRYLDLMTNQDTRERFIKRSEIISFIRHYLERSGYLEVETPMLHPIAGGATARPFITHHNALDSNFYLRIAPELYLKRLIIGGFERVFEINRNFRNEGISTRHNPEFTMLEFYTAHQDYHYAMDLTQALLQDLACDIVGTQQVIFGKYTLDFEQPFERISIKDAVMKYGGINKQELAPENINATLEHCGIPVKQGTTEGEKIYTLFEKRAEAQLIQPVFITDFPIELSPLAKRDPKNPEYAPRFELYIAGMECANSYNELNDPFEQAERFKEQLKAYSAGDQEAHQFDEDYVKALEYGLPPTVGVGIGIDRLVMILTNTQTIKEIILFPTLKRKTSAE